MKTAQVLLVEDDADNLELLAIILGEKYRVLSCSSAGEALATLETVPADLLVLDIRMSPVSGVECLQAIRAMPGYGSTPAIALTACARDVDRAAFLAAGFQAVVTKPILDHPEFLALMTTLLAPLDRPRSEEGSLTDPERNPSRAIVLEAS